MATQNVTELPQAAAQQDIRLMGVQDAVNAETEESEAHLILTTLQSLISAIEAAGINASGTKSGSDLATAISNISSELEGSVGYSLAFYPETSEIALLNSEGGQLGDAITVASSGLTGLTLSTELNDEGKYILVAKDGSGNMISSVELPATGGGGGSTHFIRLANQGSNGLAYAVAAGSTAEVSILFEELLDGSRTPYDGELDVEYKLASESSYRRAAHIAPFAQGTHTIDITEYLTTGQATNIRFTATGGDSGSTKILIFTITAVEMGISTSTTFDKVFTGNFNYSYIVTGRNLSKIVKFYIDDTLYQTVDLGTSGTGSRLTQLIDLNGGEYEYGAHELKVYFDTPDGARSNILKHVFMYNDSTSEDPIVASSFTADTYTYGETLEVSYNVYTPGSETSPSVLIELLDSEDAVWASSQLANVTNETIYTWTCDTYPSEGTVRARITVGATVRTVSAIITASGSAEEIQPVTDGLVFAFSPAGKSNNDVGREIISYPYTDIDGHSTDIDCTLSNFTWVADGYVPTAQGTALRLIGSDRMTIAVPIFSTSYTDGEGTTIRFGGTPVAAGRTIEFTLNMHEVTNRLNAVVSCMTEGHSGFIINPQTAYLLSASGANIETDSTGFVENEENVCVAYVKEDKKIRVSIVLSAADNVNGRQCLCIYINGECANSKPYSAAWNFAQTLPITIGSSDCITDIYDIRIYDRSLSEKEIRQNYYASQNTISQRMQKYKDNDIFDDEGTAVSYEKMIRKYPCLLCVGEFAPYKGAKRNCGWMLTVPDATQEEGYRVEFELFDKKDGKFVSSNNVQGTSSQKFMRKNFKVYLAKLDENDEVKKVKYVMHRNGSGIGASTLCWKADYMSTNHANTFNANVADDMMSTLAPNGNAATIQNCVNGFRCILFQQETEDGEIVFAGDGTLNNDKGNAEVFGLKTSGDSGNDTKCQKVEFLNNTADLCYFKNDRLRHLTGGAEDVYGAFESTYPDQGDLEDEGLLPNWDHWQILVTWVANRANFIDASTEAHSYTYNGNTYSNEREYKKAVFINEFERHFHKKRALLYYLFIQLTAMVDNRAKNMFMTCFDVRREQLVDTNGNTINVADCIDSNGDFDTSMIDWENSTFAIWETTLYDLDSCYSVENSGYLRVPYYADWNYELKGAKQFNGHDSRLWLMVEEAFEAELKTAAQEAAEAGILTYDNLIEKHITNNAEKICAALINQDMIYKYEAPWTEGYWDYSQSSTNPTRVQSDMYKYLHRGQRIEQEQAYIYNRSHLWYSRWQTSQYRNNNINFRAGSTVAQADADITITANTALYLGAKWGDTSTSPVIQSAAIVMPNTPTTLVSPGGVGRSDTIYIYSGTDLIDIGDVSAFMPYEVTLTNATRLRRLILGSSEVTNTSLSSLNTSACTLLERINVEGCSSLTTLNLSSNKLIKEIYAAGSGLTDLTVPEGANITAIELPATISSIKLIGHKTMENFSAEGYGALTQLRVENTPNVPTDEILLARAAQLTGGIRLVGVDWELEDDTVLKLLLSDDIKGKYIMADGTLSEDKTAYPYISGTVTVPSANRTLKGYLAQIYPDLTIQAARESYTVSFFNDNGVLIETKECNYGTATTHTIAPTKASTASYTYTFASYTAYKGEIAIDGTMTRTETAASIDNVTTDVYALATYNAVARQYTVRVCDDNGDELWSSGSTKYTIGTEVGIQIAADYDIVKAGYIHSGFAAGSDSSNVLEYNQDNVTLTEEMTDGSDYITFEPTYDAVEMPTEDIISAAQLTPAQMKAVGSKIASAELELDESGTGSGVTPDGWTVLKGIDDTAAYYQVSKLGEATVKLYLNSQFTMSDQYTTYNSSTKEYTKTKTSRSYKIYDFRHDVDSEDNTIGITCGLTTTYATAQMNAATIKVYDFDIDGANYTSYGATTAANASASATIEHTITAEEKAQGYAEFTFNKPTYLTRIEVSAGDTVTGTWNFAGTAAYYAGSGGWIDVAPSGTPVPGSYISDVANKKAYKIGHAVYSILKNELGDSMTTNGSYGGVIGKSAYDEAYAMFGSDPASGETKQAIAGGVYTTTEYDGSSYSCFGGAVLDTTNGYINHWTIRNAPASTTTEAHRVYTEIGAGVKIRIPVASGDTTITVTAWAQYALGGYILSNARRYVTGTIIPRLPIAWRSAMTAAKKGCIVDTRRRIEYITDKVWLFSQTAVGFSDTAPYKQEEETAAMIADGRTTYRYPTFTDNASRIRSSAGWWLRSALGSSSSGFYIVNLSGGSSYYSGAPNHGGIVPGFAIGDQVSPALVAGGEESESQS